MSVITTLMETARSDTELLRNLDSQGDDFSIPRDVDFLLRAPDKQKTELVRDFINDHNYGRAVAQEAGGDHRVLVVINTPIQQPIICSISGFMACLCALYSLEYDGWGCVVQRRT